MKDIRDHYRLKPEYTRRKQRQHQRKSGCHISLRKPSRPPCCLAQTDAISALLSSTRQRNRLVVSGG